MQYYVCFECDTIETVSCYVPELIHTHKDGPLDRALSYKLMDMPTLRHARAFVKGRKRSNKIKEVRSTTT